MTDGTPFKQCSACHASWADCRDLVLDRELRVEGYQACFVDVEYGLILFTHLAEGCKTTLAVRASKFRPLYDGPEYPDPKTGLEECLRLCLEKQRLEDCTAECAMAWVRHVLQWLRRHELPPHVAGA